MTWRSKKQVLPRSSVEAKFRCMEQGICELMWRSSQMKELKIANGGSMMLYCNNKAAVSIAHNAV